MKEGLEIKLSNRQNKIIEIVKNDEPITSKDIANQLNLTRSALRSDLSILTMANILEAKPRVGYFYVQDSSHLTDFNELYNIKLSKIKSVPVVVKEETSVYNAIVTLFLEDVGSLFVIDDDEALVGVISRKDLLKLTIGETDINQVPVSVVMTRMPNIITTRDNDTVFEAAEKLVNYEIDALPVVENLTDKAGVPLEDKLKVIGRVSKTNITRVFTDFGLEM
ncbi:helix-turn-helix transcriptional regulator [Selenihalanaerobacter shriftii]|uniref:CBS domain-containing protein n=1 Tax=Selenihalanaerobacter shriftii TaxID=142842 RepID=A0A1T4MX70_9FIRM|nr:helix-turn-helix transcriptional regulator [Selenihalanaerobacter shriftii]SJZ71563.1 CBS domain-containing protein [Selenihalanaerobacter shriftii]